MNGNRILCMYGRQMGYTLVESLRLFFGISEEGAAATEEEIHTGKMEQNDILRLLLSG